MSLRNCLLILCFLGLCLIVGGRVVDLTHTLHDKVPKLTLSVEFSHFASNLEYGAADEKVCLGTHLSTHFDAPCDFCKRRNKWCVEDVPVERLVSRPAVIVDVRDKVFKDDRVVRQEYQLSKDDLLEWERREGEIPHGSVVLLLTGWSRFWSNATLYRGTAETDDKKTKFPSFSKEAAEWLANERDIFGVGVDTLSVDNKLTPNFGAHMAFCDKNIYNLENVANIEELPASGAFLNVGVAKFGHGATGGPVRITADIRNGSGSSSSLALSLIIILCAVVQGFVLYLP